MIPLLVTSLVGGCVLPKSVGDGRDDGSSTGGDAGETEPAGSSSGDATATATGGTTDEPETATGPAFQCPQTPEFQCTDPFVCTEDVCGGPFSPFDPNGCLRPSCGGPDDCATGETCLFPIDYGGCASSGMFCSDGATGQCECGGNPDCGGGHCLPDDEVPPLECFGLPDAESCEDAGCNHFETVLEVSDTCECTPDQPACLLFMGGIGGAASPDFFWHEATGTVAMFSTSWLELPVGWRRCTEAGAPPACDCYEPFTEPACP